MRGFNEELGKAKSETNNLQERREPGLYVELYKNYRISSPRQIVRKEALEVVTSLEHDYSQIVGSLERFKKLETQDREAIKQILVSALSRIGIRP